MYKPDSQYNSDEPKKQKTKKKTRYDNNEYFMGINTVSITHSSVLLTSTPDKTIKI